MKALSKGKPKKQTKHSEKLKLSFKIFEKLSKYRKYWLLAILIVIGVLFVWQLSQLWLVQASFSKTKTYPKASVLDVSVGNLSNDQLATTLAQLKSKFEIQKITLVNVKDKWYFSFSQLGITLDAQSTSQAIWGLNDLSFIDKYRLIIGNISAAITPTVVIDKDKCTKSLASITIAQIEPKDALFYFDQKINIKPDESGSKFNSTLTCSELSKRLASNLTVADVSLDVIQANFTKDNLEPKLATVQSLAGQSLSLESGAYKQLLTPERLLGLLEISKGDSGVQVNWSSAKLDELIDGIATEVNTYNSSPALSACQTVSSVGGNWLDKTATKKIFTDIGNGSSRSYTLPIAYYAPVINTITPVSAGSSGTVYLTFDDGLAYGDQIMNYASCYGIKVTFFEIGSRVDIDSVALRRAVAEGHAVQSHGYEHAVYGYGDHSYDWQDNDLKQSINAITSVTGVRPTYFRPPGGNRSATTYAAASANGLNLILWGVSSADTVVGFGSSTICSNVLAGVFPGASVLMHSSKQTTANAVPCIIEGLATRGYNMQALR